MKNSFIKKTNLLSANLDKEPMIKLAMSRQENRHSRPGMDLVRDEVSYGVCIFFSFVIYSYSQHLSYVTKFNN
jgi:hypothetical protein